MIAQTSRRALFGAGASMLLLAAPAAGAGKAMELDGDLIRACADFAEAERRVAVADALPTVEDVEWDAVIDVPGRAWMVALARVNACLPPRTPEGLQAKAMAAFTALLRFHAEAREADLLASDPSEAGLALSVLRDVIGRAGA